MQRQRVTNIIARATALVTSAQVRGMYGDHKLLFKVAYLLKLAVRYGELPGDVTAILAAPAPPSAPSARTKPFAWMANEVRWLQF